MDPGNQVRKRGTLRSPWVEERTEGRGFEIPGKLCFTGPRVSAPCPLLPPGLCPYSALFLPCPVWPILLESAPTLLTSIAQS